MLPCESTTRHVGAVESGLTFVLEHVGGVSAAVDRAAGRGARK